MSRLEHDLLALLERLLEVLEVGLVGREAHDHVHHLVHRGRLGRKAGGGTQHRKPPTWRSARSLLSAALGGCWAGARDSRRVPPFALPSSAPFAGQWPLPLAGSPVAHRPALS